MQHEIAVLLGVRFAFREIDASSVQIAWIALLSVEDFNITIPTAIHDFRRAVCIYHFAAGLWIEVNGFHTVRFKFGVIVLDKFEDLCYTDLGVIRGVFDTRVDFSKFRGGDLVG